MTAAVFPTLGTMKRDWMKDPRALTMSLNTLVECCFMSYDWQNDLKKEQPQRMMCMEVSLSRRLAIKFTEIVQNYTVKNTVLGHLRHPT